MGGVTTSAASVFSSARSLIAGGRIMCSLLDPAGQVRGWLKRNFRERAALLLNRWRHYPVGLNCHRSRGSAACRRRKVYFLNRRLPATVLQGRPQSTLDAVNVLLDEYAGSVWQRWEAQARPGHEPRGGSGRSFCKIIRQWRIRIGPNQSRCKCGSNEQWCAG